MTFTTVGTPNYRRMAETLARILAERQGADVVSVRFTLRPSSVVSGDTFPGGEGRPEEGRGVSA